MRDPSLQYNRGVADYVYEEMGPEEQDLDWSVTRQVMKDQQLLSTLLDAEEGGEKHAIVALVSQGEVKDLYVSPESAVKEKFPFNPISDAFDFYVPGHSVCLVIARDNRVVVSVNGLLSRF